MECAIRITTNIAVTVTVTDTVTSVYKRKVSSMTVRNLYKILNLIKYRKLKPETPRHICDWELSSVYGTEPNNERNKIKADDDG